MPARRQRLERGAQRGHAGRRQRAHRGAVVGELARDQLRPRRLALRGVIGLRELPRRLDRLRPPRREEHAVQFPGRELGDPCRELDRARVGVAPVRVEAELLCLARRGLAELGAAVADVHAVQRRQPVEVALAVLVVHVAAVSAHDDRDVAVLVHTHPREVHPQVALGQLLQVPGGVASALPAGLLGGVDRCGCHRALSSRTRRIQLDTEDNGTPPRCLAQGASRSTSIPAIVLDVQIRQDVLGIAPLVRRQLRT